MPAEAQPAPWTDAPGPGRVHDTPGGCAVPPPGRRFVHLPRSLFHRGWLESLKSAVPYDARDWDPTSRTWEVAADYVTFTLRLSRTVFGHIAEVARFTDDAPPDAYRVLHLRETAPPELVESAFRCLAKLEHPDRGGTDDGMRALTAARDALRGLVAS